jgi:hypothetical protein
MIDLYCWKIFIVLIFIVSPIYKNIVTHNFPNIQYVAQVHYNSHHLNLLHRLCWFLPLHLLLLYLKSYILPIFDYCDVVWFSCTKSDSHLLIFSSTLLDTQYFADAHTLPPPQLIVTLASIPVLQKESACCPNNFQVFIFKSYLSSIFPLPTSSHITRSNTFSQLNLLPTRSLFGQKAFCFAGAVLWRSLLPKIRVTKNYRAFTSFAQDLILT